MSQNGQKPTSLMMFLTKNLKPKICSFIARRLIESFEGLNSSLARLAEELYTVVKTRETA